jgi:PIN domain nuclease of toxin-antitoxin system
VRILLDTHTFLWFIGGHASLSAAARAAIEDPAADVFVSVASAWELAIKVGTGKLTINRPSVAVFVEEAMAGAGLDYLRIEPAHVFRVATMPMHHRDPFDRLLVAQALEENMPLVSREAVAFSPYGVTLLW